MARPRRALALIFAIGLGGCGGTVAPADDAATDAPAASDAARDVGLPDAVSFSDAGPVPVDVWGPASHVAVVRPEEHGAIADDDGDDVDALVAAVDALPAEGGIVLFGAGRYLKAHRLWHIRRSHVLLWAPNGRATLHGVVRPKTDAERADPTYCGVREQATIFEDTSGGGVFGLHFTSTASERMACAEDNQLVLDSAQSAEVIGVEIEGSSGTGMFAWAATPGDPPAADLFIEGNFVHHTWADAIHHTSGTQRSNVWGNWIFNEAPSLGDDGVACVTYGVSSPRCGAMEWWNNRYLGGAHGRGLAVIGGQDVLIHHNWVIRASAAGVIVASEDGYGTPSSERIDIANNWIVESPDGSVDNGHAGILVSGGNPGAPPLRDVHAHGNVIVRPAGDRVERAEGSYDAASVTFDDVTDPTALPSPMPTLADARPRDTRILRTRDTSFVPEAMRAGLHRIHLRERPGDGAIEERFEYVVHGDASALGAWLATLPSPWARVEVRDGYAVVFTRVPVALNAGLTGVSFDALRAGDRDGTLAWLWARLDADAPD